MKRVLCCGIVASFAMSSSAEAHLTNTGLGPFYDGLAHLFVSPEDLLPVIALALLAGLRGPQSGRAVLFVLPVVWLLGAVLGQMLAFTSPLTAVTAVITFVLGALVAADLRTPLAIIIGLAALTGLLHGALNGSEFAHQHSAGLTPVGIALSIFVVVALLTGQVTEVRAAWARIAVRVAGSWIAAIAMLIFGWSMRA